MKAKHLCVIIITTLIQYNVFSQSNFLNDEFSQYQWYLETIHVPEAWSITKGAPEVTIAIIDGGVHWTNADLGPEYDNHSVFWNNPGEDPWIPWSNPDGGDKQDGNDPYAYIDDYHGMDFYQKASGNIFVADNSPIPNFTEHPYYHGTSLAGIIAAKTNNNLYLSGIGGGDLAMGIEGLKILPIKIGDKDSQAQSSVQLSFNADSLAKAISYAVNMGAKVINISLGFDSNPHYSNAIQDAINYANSHNVTVVVSAGNSNTTMNTLPAICDGVIRVGASTKEDRRWYASNYGSGNRPLDLVAPGEQIPVLTSDGVILYPEPTPGNSLSGTSYAAAMVSATIGLMLSVNPGLTPEQIRQILHESSDKVNPQEYPYINGYNDYMGYGRLNTYQAVCKAISQIGTHTITTTNQVWNTARYSGDIIVKQGSTLTIRTTVYMNPGSKIIIEPGAQLILDNAYLTNCHVCGNNSQMWKGIEVWGNSFSPQYQLPDGSLLQGFLKVINSTIEHAICAVDLWKPDDYLKAGGIVKAYNSVFKNNAKSIHCAYYPHPTVATQITSPNLSLVRNCNFIINADYLPSTPFYKHIDLSEINSFRVEGCDFSVLNVPGVMSNNHAIAAYNAGLQVTAPCTNITIPCSNFDYSSFSNFNRAIAIIPSSSKTFLISRTNFINNGYGVYVSGAKNECILFNNFFLGPNYGDNCSEGSPSYGIYLENSSGFLIEENTFQKATGAPVGSYTGIAAISCPSEYDVIYKNSFTGLSEGNYALGINRKDWDDDHKGISYECNLNSNNTVDFRVTGPSDTLAMINGHIGWPIRAAGNTFSAPAPGIWHFRNEGRQDIRYYYYGNGDQEPTLIYTLSNSPDEYFIKIPAPQNSCPSHFGSGSSAATENLLVLTQEQKEAIENEYALATSNYNAAKELYDYLKDGGNTEATILTVETAQPEQMWQLVSDLLAKSPYLSEEVLRAAADQIQVIPEAELFDILAANPDELRNKRLLEYLEQKENPLPGYMIDLLRQVALGSSAKTVLIEQMTEYKAQGVHAVQKLLRSALNDTVMDRVYVRGLLKRLSTAEADEQIGFSYLDEGNIDSAFLVFGSIPQKYGLQGEELASFNAFTEVLGFLVQLQQSGRTVYELDSLEVAWLDSYASNDQGKAGSMARAMLEYGGYNHYSHCPELNASWTKQSKPVTQNKGDAGLRLTVKPNPASTWVAFDYELPSGISEATLTLSDTKGTTLETIYLTCNRGQWVWDARKTGSGVYFYRIQVGNRSASGKFVVR